MTTIPEKLNTMAKISLLASCLLSLATLSFPTLAADESFKVYGYEIVKTYPHDDNAFTQGLVIHDGKLYESTGRNGQSGIRLVDLESGDLLERKNLASRFFGEGITILNDKIYQLTWQAQLGFVYDLDTFVQEKSFYVPGEGWGITDDGEQLIMSDGTPELRFLDPETLQETHRVQVTANGTPITYLNELEYINGEVWANVWYQDIIVRIDPATGNVTGVVNLMGLHPERRTRDEVLNGIAWDEATGKIYVTGKLWSALYEITVTE
ncbi:MAG: glutaminyl-peptide cyclotransferase [Pseudohongiellaceae bacterium]